MADSNPTVKITLALAPETAAYVKELVARMNANDDDLSFRTHGPMTIEKLGLMLYQDAAMVVSRPGSWEGSTMEGLLIKHGYRL